MSRTISEPQQPQASVSPVRESRADRLAAEAAEAAQVRALTSHPDVIALRVEKVRRQVDALVWLGIVLGLGFTMVNVQHFAAAGAPAGSLPWLAAWLLDPMVSLVLMAVLLAEQVTARYQVPAAPWARRAKWFAFTATYTMNTWTSWASLDPAGIVLHSVPPVGVLCAAEAAPWLRDRLTEAVHAAARDSRTSPASHDPAETVAETAPAPAGEQAARPVPEPDADSSANTADAGVESEPTPVRERASAASARAPANTASEGAPNGRKLLADYVAEARAALTPGVEISPAWVRQVTDCARSTSAKVAAELRAEQHTANTAPVLTTAPAAPDAAAEPVREAA